MSFEGLISSSRVKSNGFPHSPNFYVSAGAISQSPLSLSIKKKMEGRGRMSLNGEGVEESVMGRMNREDVMYEVNEGDAASGDDQDPNLDHDHNDAPPRRRYHRHTPQQIQELESLFRECPHPDESQRLELSRRLGLGPRQIKFWFQNRRTQMKTQVERHENAMLRHDNERLRNENAELKGTLMNPSCRTCGGQLVQKQGGETNPAVQQLRIQNALLIEELTRCSYLAYKFLGHPVPEIVKRYLPSSSSSNSNHPVGMNGLGGMTAPTPQFADGLGMPINGNEVLSQNKMYKDLALAAMDELVKMAQMDGPLWIRSIDGEQEILNREEYTRIFPHSFGVKPNGFVSEASRDSGLVLMNSLDLIEALMDPNRWTDMFPCLVGRASTVEMISNGSTNGTKDGAVKVVFAEFQLLSPLVPVRRAKFLRFCKQHSENIWAVVDVSIDYPQESLNQSSFTTYCRRLPSGCIVQELPNDCCKVTWIEHCEYDERVVQNLCRSLVNSGMGFGAQRWMVTLQRQSEYLSILMKPTLLNQYSSGINPVGRKSFLKLADRMTYNFSAAICASSVQNWENLHVNSVGQDVRALVRKNLDNRNEPPGVVLCAATSVWMPVTRQKLFDFMRDERMRYRWDVLSNGGPIEVMSQIQKAHAVGNGVALLRTNAMNANEGAVLILQETWTDASGSLIVYAPIDSPSMMRVMNGGDSTSVVLLPSGFAILPDGRDRPTHCNGTVIKTESKAAYGCILTIGFQILVDTLPTANLTVDSVETVNSLISCTIQKIRAAVLNI